MKMSMMDYSKRYISSNKDSWVFALTLWGSASGAVPPSFWLEVYPPQSVEVLDKNGDPATFFSLPEYMMTPEFPMRMIGYQMPQRSEIRVHELSLAETDELLQHMRNCDSNGVDYPNMDGATWTLDDLENTLTTLMAERLLLKGTIPGG